MSFIIPICTQPLPPLADDSGMPNETDPQPQPIVLEPAADRRARWQSAADASNTPLADWIAEAADTAAARGSAR